MVSQLFEGICKFIWSGSCQNTNYFINLLFSVHAQVEKNNIEIF